MAYASTRVRGAIGAALAAALLTAMTASPSPAESQVDPASPAPSPHQLQKQVRKILGQDTGRQPRKGDTSDRRTTTTTKYTPPEGPLFNVPRSPDDTKMLRLENQILPAIRHARPKSIIRFSMFSYDRMPITKALIAAKKKGVSVQVLVNDHEITHAQRVLRRAIGHDRHKKNWIYQCKNGCRSSGENLHDKFYLFSHTGAARSVVMTGSINMKMNGHKNQYNDLWSHNDNDGLFKAFDNLFEHLKADKLDKPTYWVQNIGNHFQLQATPFHNYGPKNDPIMSILRPVHCSGAQGSTGNNGHTVVRVIMHAWGEERGAYIANKLRRLYANGCDVKLLYGFSGLQVRKELRKSTKRGKVPIRSTGYDTNCDTELDLYTHQKNLFISGNYAKNPKTQLVVTGSSNWTGDGMRGDEEIFKILGMKTFPGYARDFNWLWDYRSHSVPWSPTSGKAYEPAPTHANGYSCDDQPPSTRTSATNPLHSELGINGPEWEND